MFMSNLGYMNLRLRHSKQSNDSYERKRMNILYTQCIFTFSVSNRDFNKHDGGGRKIYSGGRKQPFNSFSCILQFPEMTMVTSTLASIERRPTPTNTYNSIYITRFNISVQWHKHF